MSATYTITYSVGTSRHDERRYVVRGIPAGTLARNIERMQAKGKTIYAVERTSSDLD